MCVTQWPSDCPRKVLPGQGDGQLRSFCLFLNFLLLGVSEGRNGIWGSSPPPGPLSSAQSFSRVRLCNPMNHSTPGLPIHHRLPKFTQTHVHRVGDAISHLIFCRPLLLMPPIPPSIRVFFSESVLHIKEPNNQVPKYWSFSFSISPSNEHPGLISLGWTGWVSL